MTTAVRVASTHTIPTHVIQAASLVGQVVTVNERQCTVHSVEGTDWYAFDQDGQVSIDLNMPHASWLTTPVVTLLPMGCKIGEGVSFVEMLPLVRRGVCLTKW